MAQLAIKGHATRGKEVIKLLEMLGGKDDNYYCGEFIDKIYFINDDGYIESCNRMQHLEYFQLSLEEFLEKFPYKVGDRVKCWINGYCSINDIKDIRWDSIMNEIKYKIGDYWHDALNLEPFEEEIVDEMNKVVFEGTMEEKSVNHVYDVDVISFDNAQKDIYELDLKDKFHVILRKGKYYVERIKPKYPTTYEECCKIIGANSCVRLVYDLTDGKTYSHDLNNLQHYNNLRRLLICRDAYWKIAGEQMGLGKPWEQDYDDRCFIIRNDSGYVYTYEYHGSDKFILAFPTAEMRDTFYENFKDLIKSCKELL